MSNEANKPKPNPSQSPGKTPQDANKVKDQKTTPPTVSPPGKTPPTMKVAAPGAPVPNLFRRWDWLAFALTTVVVMIGYFYTLAPDLTLEDSGELAVASYYAGVPHPPGYPVWTIYTWIFTWLFPFSNIAWRVGLSSAVAGAFSCGFVALLVSRGSSMLMQGISTLKDVEAKYEHWINLVAGFAAGMLLGYNGFMWSQAVIVEVYTLSVLSLVLVLCFLLRWIYAPQQRRYLYLAAFMFGICLNNHQTLVVASMGIEILILAVQPRLGRNLLIVNSLIYFAVLMLRAKGQVTFLEGTLLGIFHAVGISSSLGALYLAAKTKNILADWLPVLIMGVLFGIGMAFYFYMPISSMTNPPLNWGYPRTETGFWHAFTRGQYDKTNPTNPFSLKFVDQVVMLVGGAIEEFNFINLIIGLLPFVFYKRMLKRDRAWIVGLSALYVFLAFLLLILLNPGTDMQSKEQTRVFFAASHVIIAIAIGYGIAIIGTLIATEYQKIRSYLLIAAAVACAIALYNRLDLKSEFPLDKYNATFLLGLTLVATGGFFVSRERMPLALILGIFAIMPLYSVFAHWSDNEQRGHLFGYWFGHDMFEPPYNLYEPMEKNTVLFGGTDPGRFNPTYMIFCESFIPPSKKRNPKFDRRDVYLITQNALADGTYLDYIRAHYNRSAQQDPFFFVNFFRTTREEDMGSTNLFARMMLPVDRFFTKVGARVEKRRRAEGVYPPQDNPPPAPPDMVNNPYDVGAYLSKEILTPTPEDSQQAFAEYIQDAQKRLQHDMSNPNAPRQIRPGEDVRVVDNRISVSGQVAVMAINALLTKIIFDKNPTNAFYVEESFPLDWMFPHLTPYGIIMKINRQHVSEFTEEMIRKDHEFWSNYSKRLIGNWIKYETTTKEICDFAERVYIRRDFRGFTGSKEFVRDDNAQKAFSKLRSAIGGLYFWRVQNVKNAIENQRTLKEAEFAYKQSFAFCPYSPEAVFKYVSLLVNLGRAQEADMVVKTCLRWDPENPGMLSLAENLAQILASSPQGQQTAVPNTGATQAAQTVVPGAAQLATLEEQYRKDPGNLTTAFNLASLYFQMQRTNEGYRILEDLIARSNATPQSVLSVARAYSDLGDVRRLEKAFIRATEVMPQSPETWYDLARVQISMMKTNAGLNTFKKAVELSNERRATDPKAFDVAKDARTNRNFTPVSNNPTFQELTAPK
jgi:tetratricopeptide (TPR) repeat protein